MADTELHAHHVLTVVTRARRFPSQDHYSPHRLLAVLLGYLLAAMIAAAMAMHGRPDAMGYLASTFVLGSFASRSMMPLRVLAALSNLAFVGYALQRSLPPVLLLHAMLLPVNLWRIAELTGLSRIIARRFRRRTPSRRT
jgi:hypothetical protein